MHGFLSSDSHVQFYNFFTNFTFKCPSSFKTDFDATCQILLYDFGTRGYPASKFKVIKSRLNVWYKYHLKNQIPKPSPPKYYQSSLIIHSLIKYYLNYINKLLLPVADPGEPVEGGDFSNLKFFFETQSF